MKNILIGNTNNGWEVDENKSILTLYLPLNLVDKLKKKKDYLEIAFSDIQNIYVGWNNVPAAWGENQHFVILKINTHSGEEIIFDGTKNGVPREMFKQAILLLKNNHVIFDDPYGILEELFNSDKSIWEILERAELEKREKKKDEKKG